jgi:transcriptional regulator with XRE-family HTH domain
MTRKTKSLRAELEQMTVPFEMVGRQISGVKGWLRTVRQMGALRVKEIACRMRVLKREILRLEVAEVQGRITLGKLRATADALDCELVYTFLPKQTTFEELAQRESSRKKEARQERVRQRMRKEIEKRYGEVNVLTLLALEVKREVKKRGMKILGKKLTAE